MIMTKADDSDMNKTTKTRQAEYMSPKLKIDGKQPSVDVIHAMTEETFVKPKES